MAIVQPRRAEYSRMARFCIAIVCCSSVDTRAYRPARNIFAGLRAWPKTYLDFGFWEAPFAGISERYLTMAGVDRFRLGAGDSSKASRLPIRCQFGGVALQLDEVIERIGSC